MSWEIHETIGALRPYPSAVTVHREFGNEVLRYVPERTCQMEYDKEKHCVFCSNCGEEIDRYTCEWCEPMEYSYPFCYQCGARVKSKD